MNSSLVRTLKRILLVLGLGGAAVYQTTCTASDLLASYGLSSLLSALSTTTST